MDQQEIFNRLKEEWSLTVPEVVSAEKILEQLEARISYLLVHHPERFFQLMYWLDIAERKVNEALQSPDDGIRRIAQLVYDRQVQKIESRSHNNANGQDEDPELQW